MKKTVTALALILLLIANACFAEGLFVPSILAEKYNACAAGTLNALLNDATAAGALAEELKLSYVGLDNGQVCYENPSGSVTVWFSASEASVSASSLTASARTDTLALYILCAAADALEPGAGLLDWMSSVSGSASRDCGSFTVRYTAGGDTTTLSLTK